jgi:hypothetical protein
MCPWQLVKEPSRKPQPLLPQKHDDAKEKMGGVPYALDRARSPVLALGADADAASSNTVPRLQNSESFSLSEISVGPLFTVTRPLLFTFTHCYRHAIFHHYP